MNDDRYVNDFINAIESWPYADKVFGSCEDPQGCVLDLARHIVSRITGE